MGILIVASEFGAYIRRELERHNVSEKYTIVDQYKGEYPEKYQRIIFVDNSFLGYAYIEIVKNDGGYKYNLSVSPDELIGFILDLQRGL